MVKKAFSDTQEWALNIRLRNSCTINAIPKPFSSFSCVVSLNIVHMTCNEAIPVNGYEYDFVDTYYATTGFVDSMKTNNAVPHISPIFHRNDTHWIVHCILELQVAFHITQNAKIVQMAKNNGNIYITSVWFRNFGDGGWQQEENILRLTFLF